MPTTDTLTVPEKARRPLPRPTRHPVALAFWAGVAVLACGAGFAGGLLRHAHHLIDDFLMREARDFRWVVFLDPHADRAFIEGRLLAMPGVRLSRFVSKEEALERARRWPALADGLKLTARNPLPESFEVEWDPAFLRPDLLRSLSERVASLDGVAEVGTDFSRSERLALLVRLREQTGLALSVFLGLTLLIIVGWTARILFWTLAPFPGVDMAVGTALGAAAGALGVAISSSWLGGVDPVSFAAGPAVGLLAGLGRRV